METATIVRTGKAFQQHLFPRLVLHKVTNEKQSSEERKAIRTEIDQLSRALPVREVHTHNDATLDALDVQRNLAKVFEQLYPSADALHRAASTLEALEMAMMTRLELDDLIDVLCKKFDEEGGNWRELPCMHDPSPPTVYEVL